MIAAFDLDGTLLKGNSSFSFCRYLSCKGFLPRSALLYCAFVYLRHRFFNLSLLELHESVLKQCFKGLSLHRVQDFIESFVSEVLPALWFCPAVERLRALQKEGVECVIFSNSPFFLVSPIARKLGINEVFATEYELDGDNRMKRIATLMDGEKKAECLRQKERAFSIAFSDSPLDLPFLEAADVAVAVNPKRRLRQIAAARGWEILQ